MLTKEIEEIINLFEKEKWEDLDLLLCKPKTSYINRFGRSRELDKANLAALKELGVTLENKVHKRIVGEGIEKWAEPIDEIDCETLEQSVCIRLLKDIKIRLDICDEEQKNHPYSNIFETEITAAQYILRQANLLELIDDFFYYSAKHQKWRTVPYELRDKTLHEYLDQTRGANTEDFLKIYSHFKKTRPWAFAVSMSKYIDKHYEPNSLVKIAHLILDWINLIRGEIDELYNGFNNSSGPTRVNRLLLAYSIVECSKEIGMLSERIRWRQNYESFAIDGYNRKEIISKRAKNGGEVSAKSRKLRIEDLMDKLEKFVNQNPFFATADKATDAAKEAATIASNENPKLWVQGVNQYQEYLGEIKRGEAGADLQNRYNAIFHNKTA